MKNRLLIALPLLIVALAFVADRRKTKVYLVGDSTCANKEVRAYPETGWGMPFSYFFDSTIVVDNRAKNGRSTKTFFSEGLWKPVVDSLQQGDYVFIQFGHNDEVKEKVGSYTTPDEFKRNLLRYIEETRSKKAIPVLLTPVTRRRFDSAGHILQTHEQYSKIVEDVAKQTGVAFIDADTKTRELLQTFGAENSKWLFMQLDKGEHPNYPNGRDDNTHFNELGARKVAEIILHEVKNMGLDLANHVRAPLIK